MRVGAEGMGGLWKRFAKSQATFVRGGVTSLYHIKFMNQKLLFPIITLALGAMGGFFVGKGGKTSDGTDPGAAESLSRSSRSASLGDAGSSRGGSSSRPRSADDIKSMPGQLQRMQSLLDFYAGLSPEQLEAEAKKLEDIPMPERMMASYVLFAKWAETDPMSAMAYSDRMGFTGMFVRPTIMQSWASVDPAGAAKYYSENPGQFAMMGMFGGRGGGGGPMGNGAASIIAGEWARQNPDEAMTWARNLSGAEKGNAVSSIISQVASSDPQKAMALAATLTGDDQARANRQIAGALGGKSWEEAQSFIATLPTDQQDDARRRAFEGLASKNPSEAAKQIASFADEEQRNRATVTVAEQLSRENPSEAFNLIVSATGDAQQDAMRSVMMNYARQDSAGALQAIQTIPAGETRDRAVGTYVWANTSTNHADSFALAETITDEGSRARAIGVSAAKWMSTDADAAKAAIQGSASLSDEMKTRLMEGGDFMRDWGGRDRGGDRGRD